MPAKKARPTDALIKELREFGLKYPGAHTKSPWPGHLDLAVNDKTFAYLPPEGEPFGISCKLPQSSAMALMLDGVKPTAYGLGKSGWVSAEFPDGAVPPMDMLKAWIDESYRAQAPKSLVKQLTTAAINAKAPPAKQTAPKKVATRAKAKTKSKPKTKTKTKKR